MGTTKWKKKDNIKIKKEKTKESFKQKNEKQGFTKLPSLPIIEGNTNMEDDNEPSPIFELNEENTNEFLDSGLENTNRELEEKARGLTDKVVNIRESLKKFNSLADRLFMEKYNEANLGETVERLLTDVKAWTIYEENKSCELFNGSRTTDVPEDMNITEPFDESVTPDVPEDMPTNEGGDSSLSDEEKRKKIRKLSKKGFQLTLQYVSLWFKNCLILFQALPKLILLRLDWAVYSCRKIIELFCEMIRNTESVILESDLQKVFDQFDIIIYYFMVFVFSYNWFFVFFYYEKQPNDAEQIEKNMYKYLYVSTSKFLNDNEASPGRSIKHIMGEAGFFTKNLFSPLLYILSTIIFLFTEHSDTIGFTIPNILQNIITLLGLTQFFNSLQFKFLFTLVLFYFILEPSVHIMKTITGFKISNMAPGTQYASVIIYGLMMLIGGLGIFEMFIGPDAYGFMKDIMSPKNESMKENTDKKTDLQADAINNLAKTIGESAENITEGSMWNNLGKIIITLFTFMIRCSSFFYFFNWFAVLLSIYFVTLSFFPMLLFGSKDSFEYTKNAINNSNEPCNTWKNMFANLCGFINKRSFIFVMVIILGFSFNEYRNNLGNDSLKTGLFTTCGLLLAGFSYGLYDPDKISTWLNNFLMIFNAFI